MDSSQNRKQNCLPWCSVLPLLGVVLAAELRLVEVGVWGGLRVTRDGVPSLETTEPWLPRRCDRFCIEPKIE